MDMLRTRVLSAEINCHAMGLTRFGQIDTIPGSTGHGAGTTGSCVHLSESTRSPVVVGDGGRQPPCPPLFTVSMARVSEP